MKPTSQGPLFGFAICSAWPCRAAVEMINIDKQLLLQCCVTALTCKDLLREQKPSVEEKNRFVSWIYQWRLLSKQTLVGCNVRHVCWVGKMNVDAAAGNVWLMLLRLASLEFDQIRVFFRRGVKMGHSSESLGLHWREEPGQLPEACSQQDTEFQGRLKRFDWEAAAPWTNVVGLLTLIQTVLQYLPFRAF